MAYLVDIFAGIPLNVSSVRSLGQIYASKHVDRGFAYLFSVWLPR